MGANEKVAATFGDQKTIEAIRKLAAEYPREVGESALLAEWADNELPTQRTPGIT